MDYSALDSTAKLAAGASIVLLLARGESVFLLPSQYSSRDSISLLQWTPGR